jgi:hypothetical protein
MSSKNQKIELKDLSARKEVKGGNGGLRGQRKGKKFQS